MKICSFEGCELKHQAKGYCQGHYQQHRKTGKVGPLRPKKGMKPKEEIIAEQRAHAIKMEQERAHAEAVRAKGCRVDACNRPVHVVLEGLCGAHYQQFINGKDFTPIRKFSEKQDVNAERRRCNTCNKTKPRDEFYSRTDGRPQPECKVCAKFRARINNWTRKGETDVADAIQAEWDAYTASE